PRPCARRAAWAPPAASSPNAEPPESTMASIASTVFSSARRSVSCVPGPAPRTSTAAAAGWANTTAVIPHRQRASWALPTRTPATSVIRLRGPGVIGGSVGGRWKDRVYLGLNPKTTREQGTMTIRIAAIEVSHWHALNDASYLRHLCAMPDVELIAIQDSDAEIVARRAAEVGNPQTCTDYRKMLAGLRPDFVMALGRHRQMAAIAHDLLDLGYPFLMEKPMGINAAEVDAVAAKAAKLNAFVAVPLAQRYGPFAIRARELIAAGRFGPLSHIYVRINRPGPARYPAWGCAWMLDPTEAGGGALRNLG